MQDEKIIFYIRDPDPDTMKKIECAKELELENFKTFEVFDEIQISNIDLNTPLISSRWIIQEKDDGRILNATIAKACYFQSFSKYFY